ncbi:MAG: hypothetical protein AVDCRST_MAG40-2439, partial [uncultured Gemmatimonadaceae bacterium]
EAHQAHDGGCRDDRDAHRVRGLDAAGSPDGAAVLAADQRAAPDRPGPRDQPVHQCTRRLPGPSLRPHRHRGLALLRGGQQGSERLRAAGWVHLPEPRPHRARQQDGPGGRRARARDRARGGAPLGGADAADAEGEHRRRARVRAHARVPEPGGGCRDQRRGRRDLRPLQPPGRGGGRPGRRAHHHPGGHQPARHPRDVRDPDERAAGPPGRRRGLVPHAPARGGPHRGHLRADQPDRPGDPPRARVRLAELQAVPGADRGAPALADAASAGEL